MRLTIGLKLNTLSISLLALGMGGSIYFATQLFTEDLQGYFKKNTLDTSQMFSARLRSDLKSVIDRSRTMGTTSFESFKNSQDRLRLLQEILNQDPYFLGLSLIKTDGKKTDAQWRFANTNPTIKTPLDNSTFALIDSELPLALEKAVSGAIDFTAGEISTGQRVVRVALPFIQSENQKFSHLLIAELSQERFNLLLSDGSTHHTFLVSNMGQVLASSQNSQILVGRGLPKTELTQEINSRNKVPDASFSGQRDYKDAQGEEQLAAFQSIGFGGLVVISQIPSSIAKENELKLYRRTTLLGIAFLCFALILGYMFSQSIVKPIKALNLAAERVKLGDYEAKLDTLQAPDVGDEIQQFAFTFNEMVVGLAEREKLHDTFHKFHSKEIADTLLSGAIQLGGERKNAVVFFSDVRGFTAMSEQLDPALLVSILNRYLTRMVKVIIDHEGVVDKFVGDAIMALWGIPVAKPQDVERAMMACLRMREELKELNDELLKEGLPALKIGMGLNYGPLIAGNIGSNLRMEYTVIGDTVNTASRVESLTKTYGTDLLISQNFLGQLPSGKFLVEKTAEKKVKGKSESLAVYKVNGYKKDSGETVVISTPYSDYPAELSDKVDSSSDKTESSFGPLSAKTREIPPPPKGLTQLFKKPPTPMPKPLIAKTPPTPKGPPSFKPQPLPPLPPLGAKTAIPDAPIGEPTLVGIGMPRTALAKVVPGKKAAINQLKPIRAVPIAPPIPAPAQNTQSGPDPFPLFPEEKEPSEFDISNLKIPA